MSESAFPTIFDLRSSHSQLLALQRQGMPFERLRPEVSAFVVRARQTGAVLDAEEQRTAAQGLIDYWLTKLDRAHMPFDDATLVDFDESQAPELADDQCPYVGLEAFREKDARNFFGRRDALLKALDVIRHTRFLSVIGPSGSGKSSIVLGGLLPMLKQGAIEGSAGWRYALPFAPGSEPKKNFEAAVKDVPKGDTPLVVTIDQFEELFTLTDDAAARLAFTKVVVDIVAKGGIVIATIREDYVPRLGVDATLQELFRKGDLRATPLSAAELREAIEEPARRIGLKFESGLVDALVADVVGEPAALPLLQFTLWRLWTKRQRNRLTLDCYREVGGGRSALARAADEVFDDLRIVQNQDTMRRILLRMVRPGAHSETTSSRVLVSELLRIGDDPARVQAVLDRLVAARLVRRTGRESSGDDQVEVAHEALIRNWPKLVEWVEQKRASLTELRRFETLADEWVRFGREFGYLDAEQLKEAEEWLASDEAKDIGVKESLPALVKASRELLDRTRRAERRAKGILVFLIAAVIGVLVWAVIAQQRKQRDLEATVRELTAAQNAVRAQSQKSDEVLSQAVKVVQAIDTSRKVEADPPPAFAPPVPVPPPQTLGSGRVEGSACCVVGAQDGTSFLVTAGRLFDREGDVVTLSSGVPAGTVARLLGSGATSVALVKLNEGVAVPTESMRGVARRVRPGDQVRVQRGAEAVTGRIVAVRDNDIVTTIPAQAGEAGAAVLNARGQLVGIIYAGDKSLSLVVPLAPVFTQANVTLR